MTSSCLSRRLCLNQWGWRLDYLPWAPCLFVYTILPWLSPPFLQISLYLHFQTLVWTWRLLLISWMSMYHLLTFSPHKISSLNRMYFHQKTLPVGIFQRRHSPFLVYFQSSSILHRIYLVVTYWYPYWCPEWISLLMETSQHLLLFLSMWLICHHLRISTFVIDIREYAYVSLSGSLLSYSSDISKP